jgi:myo-inositol 2-dehydrogenase/D-chiro-inositol 1-dehydrogenase
LLVHLVLSAINTNKQYCCLVHRGLLSDHYGYDETDNNVIPIIDSAYVLLDFEPDSPGSQQSALGCLELCMFAEGSRHQEEIIVTGMRGRLEAYLPENKVFLYQRPTSLWTDKSKPPPQGSFSEEVYDCSDLNNVYDFADELPSMHAGYHYCSTAIEWKYLIDAIHDAADGGKFVPKVSLEDGIKAVEMGIASLNNIASNEGIATKVTAHSSKSADNLLDMVLNAGLFDECKSNVQQQ